MTASASPTIGGELVPRTALIEATSTDAELTARVLAPLQRSSLAWWLWLGGTALLTVVFFTAMIYSVSRGVGVWGNNIPVAWAFPIINFVWWIGIGHAGTFISAFLLVMNQPWRTSINRLAETMTLFALVNAGIFPLLHLGRPWFAYWLVPYPSTLDLSPQFKSTLPWDVAAITAYLVVSALFWYLGLLPDLAAGRDRLNSRRKQRIYGVLALGWRGSGSQWRRHAATYALLAALATPLVISVHTVVSLDFAIAQVPGWHSTIFPPYFVVGAIFSGLAMLLVVLIPARRLLRLQDIITSRHLSRVAFILLATSIGVTYSYVIETFMAWYSGDEYERATYLVQRTSGPYAPLFWIMLLANVLAPQLFWWRRFRTSPVALFGVGVAVLIGMWLERFVIIVGSLQREFLPSSWQSYFPTAVDILILLGSFGLFAMLFLLFARFLPSFSLAEAKHALREGRPHGND